MNQSKFKEVMAILSETYARKVTELTARVYWNALKKYTDEQVYKAMMDYIADSELCQFWPQPGALIAKITGTTGQRKVALEDAANIAWQQIVDAIRRVGAYRNLELDDKHALYALKQIGGWQMLCRTDADKMEWRRKEFIQAYHTSFQVDDLPESLPGIGKKSQDKLESQSQLQRITNGVDKL